MVLKTGEIKYHIARVWNEFSIKIKEFQVSEQNCKILHKNMGVLRKTMGGFIPLSMSKIALQMQLGLEKFLRQALRDSHHQLPGN